MNRLTFQCCALLIAIGMAWSAPSSAQAPTEKPSAESPDKSAEKGDAPMAEHPKTAPTKRPIPPDPAAQVVEPVADPKKDSEAVKEQSEKDGEAKRRATRAAADLRALRDFERVLSLGTPLIPEQEAVVLRLAQSGAPRVRSLAVAILTWLPPQRSQAAVLKATLDNDPLVRVQATESLLSISRRTDAAGKSVIAQRAKELLSDEDSRVSCQAAGVLVSTDPQGARTSMDALSDKVPPSVYGCWQRYVGLRKRRFKKPPLPKSPLPPKTTKTPPKDLAKTPDGLNRRRTFSGDALVVATAAVMGFGLGGRINSLAVQPKDIYTYRREFTRRARQEPSILSGGGLGILGAGMLGGGAFALTTFTDKRTPSEGAALPLNAFYGTFLGLGSSVALNAQPTFSGVLVLSGGTLGLGVGAASAYLLKPSFNDLALSSSLATHGFFLGTMGTFAAIPVGLREVGNATRTDFAVGVGMGMGGVFGLAGTVLGTNTEVDAHRLLVASGIGFSAAGLLTTATFLAIPTDVVVRPRIALGIGAGALAMGSTIGYFFMPKAWAKKLALDSRGASQMLVYDEGKWRFGIPQVQSVLHGQRWVTTLSAVGGRF